MTDSSMFFGRKLLLVLLVVGYAYAQSDDSEPRSEASTDATQDAAGQAEPEEDRAHSDAQSRFGRREPGQWEQTARRQVTQLGRLQEQMRSELKLTRKQEESTDNLFRNHLRSLKNSGRGRRPFGANASDTDALKVLRNRMIEAKKAGDDETLRDLRREFRQSMESRGRSTTLTTSQFLMRIRAELDEGQRDGFQALIERLKIGASPAGHRSGIRSLWRAVVRPNVGLSDEQKMSIQAVLRDGLTGTAQANSESDERGDIAARVRAEVFGQLSKEQRATVEANLETTDGRTRGADYRERLRRRFLDRHPDNDEKPQGDGQPDEETDEP